MTRPVLLLCTLVLTAAGQSTVDLYSVRDIEQKAERLVQKHSQFASENLARYGNHYTMLAERGQTGSSELHEHETDIFVAERGEATIVTGGKIVNPHTQKPGEIRGTSIAGGERHHFAVGDIINIPAGTPHQLLLEGGKPFVYFVIKVKGE